MIAHINDMASEGLQHGNAGGLLEFRSPARPCLLLPIRLPMDSVPFPAA